MFLLGPALALLSIAALSVLTRPDAHAQQAPTISATTLTPRIATVGDRLALTIEVEHDASFTVEGPGFGDDFGRFELIEVAEPRTNGDGDAKRTTLGYTLAAFVIGSVDLPPLPVRWRGAAGEGTLMTEAQTVIIESVLVPGDNDLRPLKPQFDIADDAPSPLVPGLYVALFAALTALGYMLVSRAIGARPISAPGAAWEIPLTPAQRARAALDALAAVGAGDRDLAQYYAGIAATVRRYLSERYGFAAYAMTRTELQRHMTREELGRWPARLVANVLEQCDAVQFAGFAPAPERAEADLTAAYEIIELTQDEGEDSEAVPGSAPSAESS